MHGLNYLQQGAAACLSIQWPVACGGCGGIPAPTECNP